MIHVIAAITVKAGHKAQVIAAMKDNLAAVTAEAGCITYSPSLDVETDLPAQTPVRENVITIVEAWASEDALKAHLATPHMVAYREKVKGWVECVHLNILAPVD